MSDIFITGYSGNVGSGIATYLTENQIDFVAGVRSPEKYGGENAHVTFRKFDIEDPLTYAPALQGIKKVFLVRPPQLTDVQGIFKPFIDYCKENDIKHLVFLSLLGVEKNPFPPHHKIEKLIIASGIPFTFIRPSFFMQNLIEPHAKDIKEKNDLFIPSGRAKISFIDTEDIGEIIGVVLTQQGHTFKTYTLTGCEAVDYKYVAECMSKALGKRITYSNPSLLKFRRTMIDQGTPKEFANVMTVLYLTTKLGMANQVTDTAESLLGRKPTDIEKFINKHIEVWKS